MYSDTQAKNILKHKPVYGVKLVPSRMMANGIKFITEELKEPDFERGKFLRRSDGADFTKNVFYMVYEDQDINDGVEIHPKDLMETAGEEMFAIYDDQGMLLFTAEDLISGKMVTYPPHPKGPKAFENLAELIIAEYLCEMIRPYREAPVYCKTSNDMVDYPALSLEGIESILRTTDTEEEEAKEDIADIFNRLEVKLADAMNRLLSICDDHLYNVIVVDYIKGVGLSVSIMDDFRVLEYQAWQDNEKLPKRNWTE